MKNGDMPAYPSECRTDVVPGLTKREAFAMAAMQGLCANPSVVSIADTYEPEGMLIWLIPAAYALADEALKDSIIPQGDTHD